MEEAQQRVARLSSELAAESPHHPPPTVPPDYAQELVHLRACVEGLQREREDLRAQLMMRGERRSLGRSRSLPNPSPDLFTGELQSSVMETLIDNADSARSFLSRWYRKLSARHGLRARRVGEASHPGPRSQDRHAAHPGLQPNASTQRGSVAWDTGCVRHHQGGVGDCVLCHGLESDAPEQPRQTRSQRTLPTTQADVSSQEEVLIRSNRGRHVVPRRDGELPQVRRHSLQQADGSPERVPMHVLDALEEDLDDGPSPRWHSSSEFALHVQNRFAALDPTVRDSSVLRPTADWFRGGSVPDDR